MTTAQAIIQHIEALPEAAQNEVLDFVKYLESKSQHNILRESDATWYSYSLASALRGMEDEPSHYTLSDVKEEIL